MAYININTYDILELPEKDDLDDYFECDEFIAPIISLLNKKGYKTKFCCEGHLYDEAMASIFSPFEENEEPSENTIFGYISHEELNDSDCRYLVHKRNSGLHGYITFEPFVNFGNLLDSFPEDNAFPFYDQASNSIRWDYIKRDKKSFIERRNKEIVLQSKPYEHFKARLDFLKAVYDWVDNLPNYDDIITDDNKLKKDFFETELPLIKKRVKDESESPEIIETFFDVYLMNHRILKSKYGTFEDMLLLDSEKKISFFLDLSKEMIVKDDEGEYCIRIEYKDTVEI